MSSLRLGTRASALARWQADWVAAQLTKLGVEVQLVPISTTGDRQFGPIAAIGSEGQGIFTKEIQRALLDRRIDLAVHSLKDLPTGVVPGLVLAAVPERGPVGDVLVVVSGQWAVDSDNPPSAIRHPSSSNPQSPIPNPLPSLPPASLIGTGSLRRRAQLLHVRPDLRMTDIRGNVETRLRKLQQRDCDALILAEAGLRRLGFLPSSLEPEGANQNLPSPLDPEGANQNLPSPFGRGAGGEGERKWTVDSGQWAVGSGQWPVASEEQNSSAIRHSPSAISNPQSPIPNPSFIPLPLDLLLPAVGQGALALETREDDAATRRIVAALDHRPTHLAILAERAMLAMLQGGCLAPIAAFGRMEAGQLHLTGRVLSHDGVKKLDASHGIDIPANMEAAAEELGRRVAESLLSQDAAALIQASRVS